jgi:DNA topoisomerase-1
MKKNLVIVESPAKARTLSRILGAEYQIKACLGHVRDLPKVSLGIDVEDNFTPKYVVIPQRKKLVKELKENASKSTGIYLATDPDREGEAISWHLLEALKLKGNNLPIHRVSFHEITREAVNEAFRNPRSISMDLVDAQQARRLLDRLVGYKLSPLLWRKIQRGLSAGRVQSAAVRIIVDREKEIDNFVSEEYWTIEAELAKEADKPPKHSFRASLIGSGDGSKIEIKNEKDARSIENDLEHSEYTIANVVKKESSRQPSPPFITSTLQQEAWRRLRFTAKRTMVIAQQLYEGIAIGKEGSVGLITYMRTDSTHVAASAITETREYIKDRFGVEFLSLKPRLYEKKGKWTQEAHEAIRPTKIQREPEKLKTYLKPEQLKLYELIWKRMVASQMALAKYENITVEVKANYGEKGNKKDYLLRTTSSTLKFPGFISIYSEDRDEDTEEERSVALPKLTKGDRLDLLGLFPERNFTQPPPRYTEATLVKALEQKGIGRPSTYAPIISTIQDRDYVHKVNGRFHPDEIGIIVNDLLVAYFPKIVDLSFTARMEKELDEIAQGKKEWISILKRFYPPFEKKLHDASEEIEKIRVIKQSEEVCPECGKPMVVRIGRYGKFLACTDYPECKKTMPLLVKTGVPCPECGTTDHGELVERMSKKKRRFYGCSRYPQCKFSTWQKPVQQPCPECSGLLVVQRGDRVKCTKCDYTGRIIDLNKVEAMT